MVAGWVQELLKDGGLAATTSTQYARHFKQYKKWYNRLGNNIMENKGMQFVDEGFWLMWLAWQWKFRAYSTIVSMIFAIKHHYAMMFGFDPFKSGFSGNRVEYLRFQRALRQGKRLSKDQQRPPNMSLTKFILACLILIFTKIVYIGQFTSLEFRVF